MARKFLNGISVTGTEVIATAVATSGVQTSLLITGSADTAQTASTEKIDVNFNLARTVQWATGALTTQRAIVAQAPTYAFVAASTITTAATLAITGAPTAGANATITNAYALWVQTGISRFDGNLTTNAAITFGGTDNLFAMNARMTAQIPSANGGNGPQGMLISQTAGSNGTGQQTMFSLTGGAHVGLTASTELSQVNFNFAQTVQFATGALTTQRCVLIQAPTYAFVAASTITTASTFAITGAPTAGTNATITNAYAFLVQAGVSRLDGGVTSPRTQPTLFNEFFGFGAGNATLTGTNNVNVGYQAGDALTTTAESVFVGAQSGSNLTISQRMVAVGYRTALTVTANDAVYVGWNAGGDSGSTDSSFVVAVGSEACRYANQQTHIGIGYQACRGSTTAANNVGDANVAIGYQALKNYTNGADNIAIGWTSLTAVTTGSSNTAVGTTSGAALTTGSQNVIIGNNCAPIATAILYSVFIGDNVATNVGSAMSTGTNIAIGQSAFQGSATPANNVGINNVAIGQFAMSVFTSASNNIAIGYQALNNAAGAGGNVAIGYQALKAMVANNTCVALGYAALASATGADNFGLGANSLGNIVGGARNIAIGTNAGYGLAVTNTDCLFFGTSSGANTPNGTTRRAVFGGSGTQGYTEFYLGSGDLDATPPGTVLVSATCGFGTNIAASTLILAGGRGTGTGQGGGITFQTSPVGTTGATLQTLIDRGGVTFDGAFHFVGLATGSAPAVSTASNGRLYYNSTSQAFLISTNTGAYTALGTIGGSIAANQVAFGGGTNSIIGSSTFTYTATTGLTIAQTAVATGVQTAETITGAANTNMTAGTEVSDVNWNLNRTVQWATGSLATQRAVLIQAPTYAFVAGSVLTNAATVAITNAPTAGTNATINNSYALWVQAGRTKLDGGLFITGATPALTLAQSVIASAAPNVIMQISGAAHTNLTATVECVDANFNFSRTVQWATGAIATQRSFLVQPPTLAFVGASTVTTAATFAISGAPVAGTNATLTNTYSLWVQSGASRLDANLNSLLVLGGTVNDFHEANNRNASNGVTASSDFVCTADTGTATTNYIDIGINGSGYTGGVFGAALEGYLYTSDQNLNIGASASGKVVKMLAGGADVSANLVFTFATTVNTSNVLLNTLASATGSAGFRLPHGAAPTAPVNGDMWTTSAGGLFVRINSVTQNLNGTIGGSIASDQIAVGGVSANTIGGSSSFTWSTVGLFTAIQPANAGGTSSFMNFTAGAHTNLTTTIEVTDINFNLGRVVQWATGAITTQRAFLIQAPNYAFVGASTITNAATFAVSGAPVAGTNATLTNSYSIWMQAGTIRVDGVYSQAGAQVSGATAQFTLAPSTIATSGTPKLMVITGAANTGMTTLTEVIDVNVNLARTVQWATGAITTQRAVVIQAPTYAFVGASTITTASTLSVTNAPVAGTNATLTNRYAINVEAGAYGGPLGTAALPTYSVGQANTGMYSTSAGFIGLSSSGTLRLTIDATAFTGTLPWRGQNGTAAAPALSFSGATSMGWFGSGSGTTGVVGLGLNGVEAMRFQVTSTQSSGNVNIAPVLVASGSSCVLRVVAPADTSQTLSAESSSIIFDLSATRQFATGALTTQRAFRVAAPTYSAVAASTITTAATFAISGAPVAGTNATITNTYAFLVEAGNCKFNGTTDATTIALGAISTTGGISASKNGIFGQNVAVGVTSTATAAATTTLVAGSTRVQIFTGVTTQTLQLPAANLFGAGIAVLYVVINRSTGTVTAQRAGADTFVGGGTTDAITTLTQRYYVSDGVSVWYSLAV